MGSTTTAFCAAMKSGLPSAAYCFLAQQVYTGNTLNGNNIVTSMSSVASLAAGMPMTGSPVSGGTVLSQILSSSSVRMDTPATASATGAALTFNGDQFAMALIKVSPTGVYGSGTTNYTNIGSNSDEVTGTGYSAGGYQWPLTSNIGPALSNNVAIWSWSSNPSWTSASFSCQAGLIYSLSAIRTGTSGQACSVEDFGGTQTVTAGTFTVVLPSNASGTAILRIA